jgi:Ca2+:H+ antiporter
MSAKLGGTVAGLLNASFGNAVEIIVGIAALLQGGYASCDMTIVSS